MPRIARCPSRRRTVSGGSLSSRPRCSRTISPSGMYVIPCPYERQRPVRRRGSGDCEPSHSQNARINVVFPIPASPMIVRRRGCPLRNGASVRLLQRLELPLAADEGMAQPATRRGLISDSARTSRRQATPPAFPLAATVAGSSSSKAPRTAAAVRSPTRISPGSAACSSRAATLTASPVTNELPTRGCPTTTSPVFTPMRSESASPKSSSSRLCIESAAWSARSA